MGRKDRSLSPVRTLPRRADGAQVDFDRFNCSFTFPSILDDIFKSFRGRSASRLISPPAPTHLLVRAFVATRGLTADLSVSLRRQYFPSSVSLSKGFRRDPSIATSGNTLDPCQTSKLSPLITEQTGMLRGTTAMRSSRSMSRIGLS